LYYCIVKKVLAIKYWYWFKQDFFHKLLVLPIPSKSIVNNPDYNYHNYY